MNKIANVNTHRYHTIKTIIVQSYNLPMQAIKTIRSKQTIA